MSQPNKRPKLPPKPVQPTGRRRPPSPRCDYDPVLDAFEPDDLIDADPEPGDFWLDDDVVSEEG